VSRREMMEDSVQATGDTILCPTLRQAVIDVAEELVGAQREFWEYQGSDRFDVQHSIALMQRRDGLLGRLAEALATLHGPVTVEAPPFGSVQDFLGWLNRAAHPIAGPNYVPLHDLETDFSEIVVVCYAGAAERAAAIVKYFLVGPFAGEEYGHTVTPLSEGRALVRVRTDSTKSRRDDYYEVLEELWDMLSEGTPVRKTDKAGPGTKGTRKHEGLGLDFYLAFGI
jgi:hypothetical protein